MGRWENGKTGGGKFSNVMNPSSFTRNLNPFNLFASITRFTSIRTMVTINPPRDPNTVSNYNNWRSTHITANFDILFDQKKLVGNVVHQFKSTTNAESREIILDTSHLDIGTVKVDGQPSKWELLPPLEPFGVPLKITLDQGVELNGTIEVDVCIAFPSSFNKPHHLTNSCRSPSRPLKNAQRCSG